MRNGWAATAAAVLVLAGCTPGEDPAPDPTTTSTSQTEASIDVDAESSQDAQDSGGTASLGTAVATVRIELPEDWHYEGTYGDGAQPYAVLVDASQPYDLSEPGSDAYRESVWVQVETYRVGGTSPYGDAVPADSGALADKIAQAVDGEATVVDGEVPMVQARYTSAEGRDVVDLLALHGDVWVLARPWNVDVDGYLEDRDGILHAVLEASSIA